MSSCWAVYTPTQWCTQIKLFRCSQPTKQHLDREDTLCCVGSWMWSTPGDTGGMVVFWCLEFFLRYAKPMDHCVCWYNEPESVLVSHWCWYVHHVEGAPLALKWNQPCNSVNRKPCMQNRKKCGSPTHVHVVLTYLVESKQQELVVCSTHTHTHTHELLKKATKIKPVPIYIYPSKQYWETFCGCRSGPVSMK